MIESAAGQCLSAACFGLRSEHGRSQRVPGLSAEASREFKQTCQQMQGRMKLFSAG